MSESRLQVAVAGASGYSGGELLRLITDHSRFELALAAAGSKAGRPVAEVHPQLASLGDLRFAPTSAATLAEADVVFLALPHGESAALAQDLSGTALVVDLGADYRLESADAWATYYGGEHAGVWTYGLPEFLDSRTAIGTSTRIANPGCYATTIALSLWPLLAASLVAPTDVVVTAASGTSGAGRKASEALLATEVIGSMKAYKVGGAHQHTPEIEQTLAKAAGADVRLLFTPLLAPMSRGIIATSTAQLLPGVDQDQITTALHDAYAQEAFVHLLPAGQWPITQSVSGSNSVHLQAVVDERTRRVTVVAALDNLIKGAAGQAIQNANIALGFDEALGLSAIGVAP